MGINRNKGLVAVFVAVLLLSSMGFLMQAKAAYPPSGWGWGFEGSIMDGDEILHDYESYGGNEPFYKLNGIGGYVHGGDESVEMNVTGNSQARAIGFDLDYGSPWRVSVFAKFSNLYLPSEQVGGYAYVPMLSLKGTVDAARIDLCQGLTDNAPILVLSYGDSAGQHTVFSNGPAYIETDTWYNFTLVLSVVPESGGQSGTWTAQAYVDGVLGEERSWFDSYGAVIGSGWFGLNANQGSSYQPNIVAYFDDLYIVDDPFDVTVYEGTVIWEPWEYGYDYNPWVNAETLEPASGNAYGGIVTAQAHGGANSVWGRQGQGYGDTQRYNCDFDRFNQSFTLDYWVYVPNGGAFANEMKIQSVPYTDLITLTLDNSDGFVWTLTYYSEGTETDYVSDMEYDEWTHIELTVEWTSPEGSIILEINDTIETIAAAISFPINSYGLLPDRMVIANYQGATLGSYMDDIMLEVEGPPPTPTPTPAVPTVNPSHLPTTVVNYYFHDATLNTSGIFGYAMLTNLPYDSTLSNVTGTGVVSVSWGVRLWAGTSTSQTELTSGVVSLGTQADGDAALLSATAVLPTAYLQFGRSALKAVVYASFDGGEYVATAQYVSEPLFYTRLMNCQVTFNVYCQVDALGGDTYAVTRWGSQTYLSGIYGVTYKTPTNTDWQNYYLNRGNVTMFVLAPYVVVIGNTFYALILFALGMTVYARYRNLSMVVLFVILLSAAGGSVNILAGSAFVGVAWIICAFGLALVYWRIFR